LLFDVEAPHLAEKNELSISALLPKKRGDREAVTPREKTYLWSSAYGLDPVKWPPKIGQGGIVKNRPQKKERSGCRKNDVSTVPS
jgi:hypothetical protein